MLSLAADRFETLVERALDQLPPEFQHHLENVTVLIEERPDDALLRSLDMDPTDPEDTLFGLYEGVPLTERGFDDVLLPDTITIFRAPILAIVDSEDDVIEEVRITVVHEIGHFFGLDEERLDELGYA